MLRLDDLSRLQGDIAIFNGEGLFLATLNVAGTVYLRSLPFSRLAERIYCNGSPDRWVAQGGRFSSVSGI